MAVTLYRHNQEAYRAVCALLVALPLLRAVLYMLLELMQ